MSTNDPLAEARLFADTEYSAQEEIIIRKFQRELQEKQAQLSASGNLRSGTMVAESARIRGEEISALLKVRLDAILEGLDLHGVPIDDSIKKRIVDDGMALRDTTQREVEILRRLAGGNRNRDIAEKLFIAEETVKAHIKHIMAKLGATDRTQAVAIGVRRGIIEI